MLRLTQHWRHTGICCSFLLLQPHAAGSKEVCGHLRSASQPPCAGVTVCLVLLRCARRVSLTVLQVCVPLPPWAVRAGARETIWHDPSKVNAAIVTCGGLCPGLSPKNELFPINGLLRLQVVAAGEACRPGSG